MATDEKTQQLLTTIELLKAENRQLQASLGRHAVGLQSRDSHARFFDSWASRLAKPEVNQDLNLALAALTLHLNLDFVAFLDFLPEQNRFEYCTGYPPRDPKNTDTKVPQLTYPWLFKQMLDNMTVVIKHRDQLPSIAKKDAETLVARDIEALVAVPHFNAEGLVGVATFGLHKARTQWRESEIKLMEDFTKIAFSHIVQQRLLDQQITSKDILTGVLETTHVGYSVWDRSTGQVSYSANCGRLLGYQNNDTVDVLAHLHPDDLPKLVEQLTHTIKTGDNHSVRYRVIDKNQQIHWYQQHASSIRKDKNGKVYRVVCSFINIDEEQNAIDEQQRVRHSESALSKLVTRIHADDAADAKVGTDALSTLAEIINAERAFICIRKNGEDQLILRHEWKLDSLPSIQTVFDQLTTKNHAYTGEGFPISIDKVTDRDAGIIPKQDTSQSVLIIQATPIPNVTAYLVLERLTYAKPWTNTDKRFAATIADALNVRHIRNRLNHTIKRSEQRFREAMETTQDGIWEWDLSTNNLYLSPGLMRIAGYEANELPHTSQTLVGFSHPDELPRIRSETEKLKKGEVPFEEGLIRWIHKSGRTVWVYGRARCVERHPDGRIKRLAAVVSDHTHIIKQQEALEEARASADAANSAKTEFLARMSHEIRTPMNAILGMAHLAKDTALNKQQSNYIEHIDQAAHSLLHIINEILDFSKIEAGKLSLEHLPFKFESLFDQIDKLLSLTASNKKLELLFQSDPTIPEFLEGDSLRLGQILTNLVSNAIKFTDAGQIVVQAEFIAALDNNVRIKFSVQDSGIGISPEQRRNLFNPFTQADGSTTRRFGGTGLGLSICKRLVNLMGGDIEISSELGKGSRFEFEVNLSTCPNTARLQHAPIALSQMKTLIVDDNPTALEIINSTAKSLKLDTHTLNDGDSALNELQHNDKKYDLILMDYSMPGLDGVSASREIKRLNPNAPPMIIMVSACDRELVMTAENQGIIDGFVRKPVTQSRLYNAITRLLGTQPSAETNQPASKTQIWPELHGALVLLVEDNPVNQQVAQGFLNKQQVRVVIANNGQEAIDMLLAKEPDHFAAVLMDIEMPLVDGYQATQFIRQRPEFKGLPIIAMTAHAMKSDQQKCFDAGMDAFVHKPIKPASLFDALAQQIGQAKPS